MSLNRYTAARDRVREAAWELEDAQRALDWKLEDWFVLKGVLASHRARVARAEKNLAKAHDALAMLEA